MDAFNISFQLNFCITFTLTSSHLRSIPLFIVVTTCEGKCGSRVRVTFYPHPVLSWFYLKQFIISVLSIRFYLILSYTIDVNALYNRCLSLVSLLISPNVFYLLSLAYLFTSDSLFVHCSEPLPTTKQMDIEHKKKAYEVAYLIKKDTCMLKLG